MTSTQVGAALVEFAITALVFFVILFGLIEFSRLLFTWNTLTEISRRTARLATVCPPHHPDIRNRGIFIQLPSFTAANLNVRYFDENDNLLTNLDNSLADSVKKDPASLYNQEFGQIRYVQAMITGYQHNLFIPVVGNLVTSPPFTAVMPRESLGIGPTNTDINDCDFP